MKIETKELSNGGVLTLVKTNSISFKKGDVVLVTDPCYWFDEEDKESRLMVVMVLIVITESPKRYLVMVYRLTRDAMPSHYYHQQNDLISLINLWSLNTELFWNSL